MAEQKESSVLFSLKELMGLEEDRIRQEEGERRRQAELAEQARLDTERRAREAEEQRLRAEDDRRRSEEQRSREENARVDAIRQAEVEKARLESENNARMEAVRRQQEHERQLAALSQDKSKKNLKLAAIGSGVMLLVAVTSAVFIVKGQREEAEASEARHKQEAAEQQAKVDSLTRKLDDQTSSIKGLESDVANAKDEAARAEAQSKLVAAQKAAAETRRNLGTVKSTPAAGGGGTPKPACTCTPGDPLCSCL